MPKKHQARYRNRIPIHNESLHKLARRLRKEGTLGEVLLWQQLKGRQLGCQFHRQVPILSYIVDFYCHEIELVIEVDGSSHTVHEIGLNDVRRQRDIEALGITVLRFEERDVRRDPAQVAETIQAWLRDHSTTGESPSVTRRGS